MTTRRAILKTGVVLPAASLAGPLVMPAIGRADGGTLALERFVFDVRFAESNQIAGHVDQLGVPLSPIDDDLMRLWYDELDLLWKESPQPLAGTTLAEAAFVLETLAMDRGMRLVFRGEHGLVEDGRMAHRLIGPEASIAVFESTETPADWQAELAASITSLPLGRSEASKIDFVTYDNGLSMRDMPLVSWVIAPRDAVAVAMPG